MSRQRSMTTAIMPFGSRGWVEHPLAHRAQREARVALAARQMLSRPAIGVRFTGARASRCSADEARQSPRGTVGRLDRGEHATVVGRHVADYG